jgi:hypothetical protein
VLPPASGAIGASRVGASPSGSYHRGRRTAALRRATHTAAEPPPGVPDRRRCLPILAGQRQRTHAAHNGVSDRGRIDGVLPAIDQGPQLLDSLLAFRVHGSIFGARSGVDNQVKAL